MASDYIFTLRSTAVWVSLQSDHLLWILPSDQLDFSAQQTYFQRAVYSAQLFWVSFESADLPAALSAAAAFITPPLTPQQLLR